MARSRWKLSHFSRSIWNSIILMKEFDVLKKRMFYERSSVIPKCFTFFQVRIHKGKRYRWFAITPLSVGKKFGEFSFTRKPYHFPLKKSKKRK